MAMASGRVPDPATASGVSPGRRRNMQAIRRRDTGPERALRSALHAAGYRYRCDLRIDLSGARVRPDIVFTRRKVAVFVDGCFWHSCPEHGRQPAVNSGYWSPKLQGNRDRDRRNTQALEQAGWVVVRVWEHEPVAEAMGAVTAALSGR
ncbi:very short patch repair endonuclease [Kocuria salina]|uniref:very short patch repair endonuclease n=1 Tax=Kocuria salina TaxID=1929416 RepID=UPI001592CCF5|nr:very short patch repair endonuclease [Kocuria salina]